MSMYDKAHYNTVKYCISLQLIKINEKKKKKETTPKCNGLSNHVRFLLSLARLMEAFVGIWKVTRGLMVLGDFSSDISSPLHSGSHPPAAQPKLAHTVAGRKWQPRLRGRRETGERQEGQSHRKRSDHRTKV